MLNIHTLTEEVLDAWITKSLGYNILGLALASNDPSCGSICIERNQDNNQYNFLHYCYLSNCCCDIMLEINKEMAESSKKDGYEYEPDLLIYGHSWQCLSPVPLYSSNFQDGMPLIRENKISLIFEEQENNENWKACKNDLFARGKTELEAGMRLLVLLKFGENYNESLICL